MDLPASNLLQYRPAGPGQLRCEIDLRELLVTDSEQKRFRDRWPEFMASDPANPDIYRLDGDRLVYTTEELIPEKTDQRTPLLLVLGNPASHSVKAGIFFSFEGTGREHRFWKSILRPSGVLELALDDGLPMDERNARRRERILELDYHSPYQVGLAVFISMPSAASGPWSGIAGVHKLMGARAMKRLVAAERARVLETACKFLAPAGAGVAFQKDAWDALRSPQDPLTLQPGQS